MIATHAIIGSSTQAETCDNRDCDNRTPLLNALMNKPAPIQAEAAAVFRRLEAAGKTQRDLAEVLGIAENKVSKIKAGQRRMQAEELLTARKWLDSLEGESALDHGLMELPAQVDYVEIEVLPTYAGMGGGGTGDGDRQVALIPKTLIVDVLRGRPQDFLLINVRGDSMEPDFHHDDQILIDRRDISPAQPGPFALWDGEWGEYVVKNIERLGNGDVRVFSSNGKYTPSVVQSDQTKVIGRPVWFGRKL